MLSHHSLWTQSPRIWSGSQLGKPSPPGAPTLGDSQPWPLRPPTVRARPEPPRGSRERTSPPNRPTAAAPQRRRPTVAPWRRGEAARQRPPVRTALPPAVPRPGYLLAALGNGVALTARTGRGWRALATPPCASCPQPRAQAIPTQIRSQPRGAPAAPRRRSAPSSAALRGPCAGQTAANAESAPVLLLSPSVSRQQTNTLRTSPTRSICWVKIKHCYPASPACRRPGNTLTLEH